jgi:hypothetical protein
MKRLFERKGEDERLSVAEHFDPGSASTNCLFEQLPVRRRVTDAGTIDLDDPVAGPEPGSQQDWRRV